MLGWLAKRRKEANKRKAIEIGTRVVERINAGVELWRAERIAMRREMVAHDFDQRIVTLEAEDGLSYHEILEIDALACMKNWYEQHELIIGQTKFYISDDDLDCIEIIGGQDRFLEMIQDALREESDLLEAHINQAIQEALQLRARRDG